MPDLPLLQSFLILTPSQGGGPALLEYYVEHQVFEQAFAFGVIRGEIVQPQDGSGEWMVSSLWSSRSEYEKWLAAPDRATIMDGLRPILDGTSLQSWAEDVVRPLDPNGPLDFGVVYGTTIVHRLLVRVPPGV